MNLQSRKLDLIEYLLQVKDEKIINQFENLIDKSNLAPLSQEQLISRAEKSNLEYQTGNFKTQEQLEIDSKHW